RLLDRPGRARAHRWRPPVARRWRRPLTKACGRTERHRQRRIDGRSRPMRPGALIERALAVVGAVALAMLVVGAASLALAMQRGFHARDEPSALETIAARRL